MFGYLGFSFLGAAAAAGAGAPASITASAPWTDIFATAPASANNSNRTLSVPGGTGTVKVTWLDLSGTDAVVRRRLNSGSYIALTSEDTFAVADGDTLNFQVAGPYSLTGGFTIFVSDDDTEELIDSFEVTIS